MSAQTTIVLSPAGRFGGETGHDRLSARAGWIQQDAGCDMARILVAPTSSDSTSVATDAVPGGAAPGVRTDDERDLVGRIAVGDTGAFGVLTKRHLKVVVAIARRMLRDDAEAEDIAQETFLRLWRMSGSLDIGPGGVKPWLRRVASNLCIDRVRGRIKLTPVDELPDVPDDPTQLKGMEADETKQRVDVALKKLPERQRMALTLFHYEGMSQVEVGNVMGITDEAVESLLGRARRNLKADLVNEWRELVFDQD